MDKKIIKFGKINWINIEKFDSEAEKYLKNNFKFHYLNLKDCFDLQQNPKLDIYRNYIFLIFHFPRFNKVNYRIEANPLAIFCAKDYFITITTGKFKKLKNIFYLNQHNSRIRNEYMSDGTGFLLYKILDYLLRKSSDSIIKNLQQRIKILETKIFEEKQRRTSVSDLAILRRNILNFRSLLEPQRLVIRDLLNIPVDVIFTKEMKDYFDDIDDYLDRLWHFLENYKELVEGLNETNESLISFQTNEIIKTLTIISVALLPLTLFSSIYGMNIPLPFDNQPHFIWSIFAGIFVLIIMVLIYLKTKNKV